MILKQQKLLQLLMENGRKSSPEKSLRQLILEAGYSESAANNPAQVLHSQSWREITESIPMFDIVEKLVSNALQDRSIHGSNEAIDKLLKMQGAYAPKRIQIVTQEEEMSDYELETSILIKSIEIEERQGHIKLASLYKEVLEEYKRVHPRPQDASESHSVGI